MGEHGFGLRQQYMPRSCGRTVPEANSFHSCLFASGVGVACVRVVGAKSLHYSIGLELLYAYPGVLHKILFKARTTELENYQSHPITLVPVGDWGPKSRRDLPKWKEP